MAECSSGLEKHDGPVWQVQWLDEGPQKGEALFTAAADGRICQWDYDKVMLLAKIRDEGLADTSRWMQDPQNGYELSLSPLCISDICIHVANSANLLLLAPASGSIALVL